jgi:uncharacterized protein YkwD
MTLSRIFWPIVGILLLLLTLSACGTGLVSLQGNQAQQTATQKPATRSTTPPPPTPTRTSGGGSTSQEQQQAQYVLGLINHDRVAMGLPPYTWSAALARGARLHNMRMVAYGQLSHQCPGEPDLGIRITNDGLAWRAAGENIGWSNYPDPQQGVLSNHQAMMAEQPPNDGHRRNILSTSYTLVGIDVLIDSQHKIWLTEDFAQL